MRLIAKMRVRAAAQPWPDARQGVEEWLAVVRVAQWESPDDVRRTDPKASIIGGGLVVFDVLGGRFRLVVGINYGIKTVYFKFFGTHTQYERAYP